MISRVFLPVSSNRNRAKKRTRRPRSQLFHFQRHEIHFSCPVLFSLRPNASPHQLGDEQDRQRPRDPIQLSDLFLLGIQIVLAQRTGHGDAIRAARLGVFQDLAPPTRPKTDSAEMNRASRRNTRSCTTSSPDGRPGRARRCPSTSGTRGCRSRRRAAGAC